MTNSKPWLIAFHVVIWILPDIAIGAVSTVANQQTQVIPGPAAQAGIWLSVADLTHSPLQYTILSLPVHGTLVSSNSAISNYQAVAVGSPVDTNKCYYSPENGYLGADSFTWKVNNGVEDSNIGTFSITVTNNTVPPGSSQSSTIASNSSRARLYLNASHSDQGQILSYTNVSLPSHGILEYLDGVSGNFVQIVSNGPIRQDFWFYYTPTPGYIGPDSFSWAVDDAISTSGISVYSLTVAANSTPAANAQNCLLVQNSVRSGVNLSISHADQGQTMAYACTSLPLHGTLEYLDFSNQVYIAVSNGVPVAVSGWCYTPDSGFLGQDSFTWKVSDSVAESGDATYWIEVATNTPPYAYEYSSPVVTNPVRTPISLSYEDYESNQRMAFIPMSLPAHGKLEFSYLGSYATIATTSAPVASPAFFYTPEVGYQGLDGFTWKVNDGLEDSAVVPVTLTVGTNNAPVAYASIRTVSTASGRNSITMLYTHDDSGQSLVYRIMEIPSNGTSEALFSGVYQPITNGSATVRRDTSNSFMKSLLFGK